MHCNAAARRYALAACQRTTFNHCHHVQTVCAKIAQMKITEHTKFVVNRLNLSWRILLHCGVSATGGLAVH
jgi:hypothetical protein